MKTEFAMIMAMLAAVSSARQVNSLTYAYAKREVPQEHSHRQFLLGVKAALDLNNQFEIVDPVFSLLGNAAAAEGAGQVENLDCLQQIIADEAFTNAQAADDLDGMISALIFRALEKNTLTVGEASVACTETANNPEIDALEQHQDPASANADEINREIELELARQLASIGADPLMALLSATFTAGDVNDATGAGNSCNDDQDDVGCIFTENLIRPVVTEDEILVAVADITDGSDVAAVDADTQALIDAAAAAAEVAVGNGDAAEETGEVEEDAEVDEAVEDDTAEAEDEVEDEDAAEVCQTVRKMRRGHRAFKG